MISLLWVVKLHPVLHPGATARFDKDPQAFVAVLRILRDKVVQSSKGRVCHFNHCFSQLSDTSAESQRRAGSAGSDALSGRFGALFRCNRSAESGFFGVRHPCPAEPAEPAESAESAE